MKILYLLLPLTIIVNFAFTQSVQDIQKLQQLQKQIEQAADSKNVEKTASSASSLEAFEEDSLSKIPVEKLEAIKIQQDEEKKPGDKQEEVELSIDAQFEELEPYGYNIFYEAKLDLKPSSFGPVDKDYPLGPGDELVMTLWGEVEIRHTIMVDRNGQILIPDVGLVHVAGLTLGRAKIKINSILKNYYSGLKNNKITLEISLGKLRSIRVYVTGEVNQPGAFTVPAYVGPFAMLFYAAGVKETGSLRNIIVLRDNERIADVDFYSFLTGRVKHNQIRLQNHDVIVVPPLEKKVYLAGNVAIPAIYEIREGDGLIDLLKFAGGERTDSYLKQVEIQRFVNQQEPILMNVDYLDIKKKKENFELMPEDRVYVYKIERERKNFVTIDGPIFGPNTFTYSKGLTLKQVFAKVDSIRADAYLERILITREYEDERKEIFSVNLKSILNNQANDFELAPKDVVEFKSKNALFPIDSVSIYGAVNLPGKYVLSKNLTLKDLIYMAGGFAINAKKDVAEVSRIDLSNKSSQTLAEIFKVNLDSSYVKNDLSADENFFLKPYDNVFIFIDSEWELQRNVTIMGEVYRPGTYSLESKEDKLSHIISRAGGLKPTAYVEGGQFYRAEDDAGQIGVNFIEALDDPESQENIILEDGDEIVIPQRRYTVKVMGGVNFPSSVMFEKSMDIDDYIAAAGGLIELADEDNISVMLANGKRIKEKKWLFFPYMPDDISPGSVIYVPQLTVKETTDWSGAIRDAAAILASVASVILIINQVNN